VCFACAFVAFLCVGACVSVWILFVEGVCFCVCVRVFVRVCGTVLHV
jgi:hypothetical protein